MSKVPAVGDVQNMITRASFGAIVAYAGAALAATIFVMTMVKPETASNPVGGAILGGVLLVIAIALNVAHLASPRRKRTVMNISQKENGKTYLDVRYMDGTTETVPADGTR